jgi:hypothetical protein
MFQWARSQAMRAVDRELFSRSFIDQVLMEENNFIDKIRQHLTESLDALNQLHKYNHALIEANQQRR